MLWAGLLDAAHTKGLVGFQAPSLEQAPTKENGWTTIVRATALFQHEDGTVRAWSAIGDANPDNVGKNIAPHAIRMAETRAKARCLRDALNVGGAALEELGGFDEAPVESVAARRARAPGALRPPVSPLTVARLAALALAKKNWDAAALDAHVAATPAYGGATRTAELTEEMAQRMVTKLAGQADYEVTP